jgi:hypothetical protein
MKGFHPNYLTPVFRVWQRQQFYKTQDGRDSMVWEPDLLAPCPCGGSKRFGECCKSSLPSADRGHVQDRVLQAISAGDPDLAESIARAGLAQYVIWVRQHTAAAIHMGRKFYESIVDVDALALESLIDTMIRALEFAQKADLILPQLQRLRGSMSHLRSMVVPVRTSGRGGSRTRLSGAAESIVRYPCDLARGSQL